MLGIESLQAGIQVLGRDIANVAVAIKEVEEIGLEPQQGPPSRPEGASLLYR